MSALPGAPDAKTPPRRSGADLGRLVVAACAGRPLEGPLELDATLVRRHLLGPLAHALGAAGFAKDHVAASLLAERRLVAAVEAVEAVVGAGIPVMLIKGIAYAGRVYADAAERPMSDIDLLVPAAAHREAAAALRRLGYWPAGPKSERSRFHHALTLKRRGAAIDLHRSLLQPLRAASRDPARWLRARRAPAPLAAALIPDAADEALSCLAHIARHELAVPAINYVDAARLLGRADAEVVVERAARARLSRGVATAASRVRALAAGRAIAARLLPGTDEILALASPTRALQIARKVALLEGPGEAVRLALGAALERL